MESLLEAQKRRPGIGANQLQTQLGAKRDAMQEAKLSWPPSPGMLVTPGEHAHRNSAFVSDNGLELPQFCAQESVGWSVGVVGLRTEPWKTDWDSTSDCLAILPARFRAHE